MPYNRNSQFLFAFTQVLLKYYLLKTLVYVTCKLTKSVAMWIILAYLSTVTTENNL